MRMAKITRRAWAWIVVAAICITATVAFLAHRFRAPGPAAGAGSSAEHAPAKEDARQPPADSASRGSIPFAPRIYPATPVPPPEPAQAPGSSRPAVVRTTTRGPVVPR